MTETTLLSDELLRHLIGVGQVDIVVGVPTLNHADTIGGTLDVIDQGLMRYFPRARTVVIGADGGSSDGTLDVINDLSPRAVAPAGGLRTRHRVGTSYRGVPGRAGALRLIFTVADLLQAQAVAIYDPDGSGLVPDWIGALLEPILTRPLDVVAGSYRRHPLEGLLVTQLIRPLMRAAYGRQFDQPVLGAFSCSRRFAAGCLAQEVWDRSPFREGIDLWLAGTALCGAYLPAQAQLGRPSPPRGGSRSSLQDVFAPLVGALLATLDQHANAWVQDRTSAPVPVFGRDECSEIDAEPPVSPEPSTTFVRDVRELSPVLEQIVAADTFASLRTIAENEGTGNVRYDDEAWVATVYDFVAAHHHGVMDRSHIVQALMPLYLGRAASFIGQHANSPVGDTEQHLERLSQAFERHRQYLIEHWHNKT